MVPVKRTLQGIVGCLPASVVLRGLLCRADDLGVPAVSRRAAQQVRDQLPGLVERPELLADMIDEINPPSGNWESDPTTLH